MKVTLEVEIDPRGYLVRKVRKERGDTFENRTPWDECVEILKARGEWPTIEAAREQENERMAKLSEQK